jgi:hypothetical protein
MKKIFSIAIIISVALVSCKKSSTPGIGTAGIQATIGNNATVFNVLAYASTQKDVNTYDNTDTTYYMSIYASNSAISQPSLSVYLTSNKPIAAGTVFSDTAAYPYYYYPVIPYTTSNLEIDFEHYNDPNNAFARYYTAGVKSSPTTLTVTAVSATSISGTFQGTIYIQGDSTALKQAVTNGKFTAPIDNSY